MLNYKLLPGNNIWSSKFKIMSIFQCQKECYKTHGCFYWTYSKKKAKCYLKRWGVAGLEKPDNDWESGHRACVPTSKSKYFGWKEILTSQLL